MMMTGAFPQQPFGLQQVPQPTGFIQPQYTAMPGAFPQAANAFVTVPSHPSFQSFLQPQATGFLQPQATGANPFRQSMLMPQLTGMAAFGTGPPTQPPANSNPMFSVPPVMNQTQSAQTPNFPPISMPNGFNNGGVPGANTNSLEQNVPQRPASTPITSKTNSFGQAMQPVVSHQTGSRNPFGEPKKESPPPVPKVPTLQELATGAFNGGAGNFGLSRTQSPPAQRAASPTQGKNTPFGFLSQPPPSSSANGSFVGNVATSFSFNNNFSLDLNKPTSNATGSTTTTSTPTMSAFSSQPTGSTNASSVPSFNLPPIQPQTTGFSGLKPFKPTSSFGASLLETLPPIPGSESTTPKVEHAELNFSNGSNTTNGTASPTNGSNATSNGFSSGFASLSISNSNLPNSSPGASNSTAFSSNTNSTPFGAFSTTTGANSPPGLGALNAQPTGLTNLSFLNNSPSSFPGSNLGTGLRPQMTGGGVANPFRASMLNPLGQTATGFNPSAGVGAFSTGLTSQPTGFQPSSSFGRSLFQNPSNDMSKQQTGQQNGVASLI